MQYRLRTLLILLAVGPVVLGIPIAWQRMTYSNCGGNNAALSSVQMYVEFLQVSADESPSSEFAITSITPEQQKYLVHIANDVWIGDAQYLVSAIPYRPDSPEARRVVIVCDRSFTNVPRWTLGIAPPTHAAGLSDGSIALLTTKEFAALDLTHFVSLREVTVKQDE